MKKQKVLVTGALGFVGSNLVDMLVSQGYEVYGIDNLSSESSSLDYKNQFCEYFIRDVEDVCSIYNYKGLKFDKIFHLAAMARIQPSFEVPYDYFKSNTLGTAAVCELARLTECKSLVYATTSSKNHGTPYLTPYTYSKVAGEGIVKTYAECFGMNMSMCTFYNVYGPREPREGEWATVVAKFTRQWKEGADITVVGDGEQSRDFTHVEDICKGLIAASEGNWKGDNFDLGRGVPIKIIDIAKKLCSNEGGRWINVPLRKNEGQFTLSNWLKTKKSIGWRAETDLMDYLHNIVHTYSS